MIWRLASPNFFAEPGSIFKAAGHGYLDCSEIRMRLGGSILLSGSGSNFLAIDTPKVELLSSPK
jgi:hypothetical protein